MRIKHFLLIVTIHIFIACDNSETNFSESESESLDEKPEEIDLEPTGNLLLKINVPYGTVRKDIDKLHIVIYDEMDNTITYQTHSSGNEEQLSFYSDTAIDSNKNISIAFITNFKDEVFSSKIYKDLNLSMLGNVVNIASKANGAKTGIIDKTIVGQESRWELRSSGNGYNLIGFDNKFEGHYTDELYNNLGLKTTYIQYYNIDDIYEYKYKFLEIEELKALDIIDVSTFIEDNVRSGSIAINLPYQRAYLQIYGYESLNQFKANIGHRICFNPAILDFHGIYYSYADIFPYTKYSVQFKNYEIEGMGIPPQELTVPQNSIDYSYSNGTISYTGVTDYEVVRFYLQKQGNISMSTVLISNGNSTSITIPEVPEGLLENSLENSLKVDQLQFVQAAAESYDDFNSYEVYIKNTLKVGQHYSATSNKRERIWKSSVSQSLLPF